MKLTLIRHTSLQIAPGICYGKSDIDVAATFTAEAANTLTKLASMRFDALYTSPLQRCVKLANALSLAEPVLDNRLMELNFGEWEMQAWDDISREHFDEWAQNYATMSPPNGETFNQLQQRGVAFLDDVIERHSQGHIAIVTHGGMIRALLAHVLNMPLKGLFRFTIDYGSVTQLDFSQTVPKIERVNG